MLDFQWHLSKILRLSRHLLLILASCGDGIVISDLKEAFESFFLKRAARFNIQAGLLSFEQSLRELEDSFIRITAYGQDRVVSFQNPSVLDFVKNWLLGRSSDVWDLFESVICFEQAQRLLSVLDFVERIVRESAQDIERACAVLQRTFTSPALQLLKRADFARGFGNRSPWWKTNKTSQWHRMRACCEYLKILPSQRFREFVLTTFAEMVREVDFKDETVWSSCFDAISYTYNIP